MHDKRLQRIFSFQALYAGVPPQRALGAYGVIAYMDTVAGVWFPRGGMHALPQALADAATDAAGQDVAGRVRRVECAPRCRAVGMARLTAPAWREGPAPA